MKFIDHGTGGGPEVLTPGQCQTPSPQAGEVLVKVAFAGVNRPDCLQRIGHLSAAQEQNETKKEK